MIAPARAGPCAQPWHAIDDDRSVRRLLALALVLACRTSSPAAPTPPDDPGDDGVPDDALARIGGVVLPRAAFDDALASSARSGPRSRDESGLRRRVAAALVTKELVRQEAASLGLDDETLSARALAMAPTLDRLERLVGRAQLVPAWMVPPSFVADDVARAAAVVDARGAIAVDDAAITAEYERHKAAWISDEPWLRVVVVRVRYDDAVGVDACDQYVGRYRRCTERFPKAARPVMLDALARQAGIWRDAAEDPARVDAVRDECTAAAETTAREMESMQCDWQTQIATDHKAVATARRTARATAESLRRRLVKDPALATGSAEQLGLRDPPREQVVIPSALAPKIARAVDRLDPGQVTAAIDDGHAWVVTRLVAIWPPGTLPAEARHDELADLVRARKLYAALDGIVEDLGKTHPIELHPAFDNVLARPQ